MPVRAASTYHTRTRPACVLPRPPSPSPPSSPAAPSAFSGAAPEPGVIAGDKDPPRYEPSLRDLPPLGPPIRGRPVLLLPLLLLLLLRRPPLLPSFSCVLPFFSLLLLPLCLCRAPILARTLLAASSPRVGAPCVFTMDFYERRLRATLSAVYAAGLSLNHSRTYRLSAALPFSRPFMTS